MMARAAAASVLLGNLDVEGKEIAEEENIFSSHCVLHIQINAPFQCGAESLYGLQY